MEKNRLEKFGVFALCLFAALGAFAFDSEAWIQKRADLTNEVARLQAAYAKYAALVQTPAEDVTLPIETFPDGSVKIAVHAQKAQYFLDSGFVWAEGVTVRKFKDDGTPDMTLEAANCIIDRETKSAWAEGAATLTQGKSTFRGKGIYFSSPEAYVRVMQDSDLESMELKKGGFFKR